MRKKYKLYSTEEEWNEKHVSLMAYLGIPCPAATSYAEVQTVPNSECEDYGKYIMPVIYEGMWKCDSQFSEGVVDWQDDWVNVGG